MAQFDPLADRLESAVDRQFAEDGLYDDGTNAPFPVRVIIDLQVEQRAAFDSSLPTHRDELEIRKVYVDRPRRGHTVVVGDTTWTLDGMISDDGVVTRHWANGRKS